MDKTKCMVTGKSTISSYTISIEYLNVQKVESFVYLGTMVNFDGGFMIKIQAKKGAVNKCYFGLMKHLMSKLLSHKVKCLIYKTLIRPVLTDGSETWSIDKHGEHLHRSLERKVLWKILGPILENGCWRRCKNCEIYKLHDELVVMKFNKLHRLRWAGHVMRMEESDPAKKVLHTEPGENGYRKRGKPKLRWCNELEDVTGVGCRNWTINGQSRAERRRIIEEAKFHLGM